MDHARDRGQVNDPGDASHEPGDPAAVTDIYPTFGIGSLQVDRHAGNSHGS